jgi:hypothetical protein
VSRIFEAADEHANRLGQVLGAVCPPTPESTMALLVVAARVYAMSTPALTREEFLRLCELVYDRALTAREQGHLVLDDKAGVQ